MLTFKQKMRIADQLDANEMLCTVEIWCKNSHYHLQLQWCLAVNCNAHQSVQHNKEY